MLIRNCPAGKHLDAAVARVLGLNVVAMDWPCGYSLDGCEIEANSSRGGVPWRSVTPSPVYVPEEWVNARWPPEMRDGELYADVKPVLRYSTDIAKAWGLVLKMITASAYEFYLSHQFDGFSAYFTDPGQKLERYAEKGTAAVSIARAFLLAHGITEVEMDCE